MRISRKQLETYIPLFIVVFVVAAITRDSWIIGLKLKSRSQTCPKPEYPNKNERHTAVISIEVGNGISMDLAMCVPFAVAAWQRIGWNVTVFVVGDIDFWDSSSVLNLVKQTSEEISTDVRFILIPVDTHTMVYAKLMRIYAVLSMSWLEPEDYILISDTNLFPLKESLYDNVYRENLVTIMNHRYCCGSSKRVNKRYMYLPIVEASIGMTSKKWKSVMNINTMDTSTMEDFIDSWLDINVFFQKAEKISKFRRMDVWLPDRIISNQLRKAKAVKHKLVRTIGPDEDALPYNMVDIMSYSDARFRLSTYTEASWRRTLQLATELYNPCVVNKLLKFRSQTREIMQ